MSRSSLRAEIAFLVVLSGVAITSGCASAISGVTTGVLNKVFEPDPTRIQATFRAAEGLNPDPTGRPSPVLVRVYALQSIGRFETADFFSLFDGDETLLGTDLTYKQEFTLGPGEELELERELSGDSRFIGVIGAFREIETAAWRASMPIEPNDDSELLIELENIEVRILDAAD